MSRKVISFESMNDKNCLSTTIFFSSFIILNVIDSYENFRKISNLSKTKSTKHFDHIHVFILGRKHFSFLCVIFRNIGQKKAYM